MRGSSVRPITAITVTAATGTWRISVLQFRTQIQLQYKADVYAHRSANAVGYSALQPEIFKRRGQ